MVANMVGKKQLVLLKTKVLILQCTFTVSLPVCRMRGEETEQKLVSQAHDFSIVMPLLGSCAVSE